MCFCIFLCVIDDYFCRVIFSVGYCIYLIAFVVCDDGIVPLCVVVRFTWFLLYILGVSCSEVYVVEFWISMY